MKSSNRTWFLGVLTLLLTVSSGTVMALESDRQQPLEVSANNTDGSLGDGTTVLSGQVEIRQGTLYIQAARAEVDKVDGKVHRIRFLGEPAILEQEIEEQGLVQAEANIITYQVSAGIVELAGAADVTHPQYRISGESLTYDLDQQHFEGTGSPGTQDDPDGRIRIRLEPEVAAGLQTPPDDPDPSMVAGDASETAGAGAQTGSESEDGADAPDDDPDDDPDEDGAAPSDEGPD